MRVNLIECWAKSAFPLFLFYGQTQRSTHSPLLRSVDTVSGSPTLSLCYLVMTARVHPTSLLNSVSWLCIMQASKTFSSSSKTNKNKFSMEENSLPPFPINITRYTMSRISVQYIHYVTYFLKKNTSLIAINFRYQKLWFLFGLSWLRVYCLEL